MDLFARLQERAQQLQHAEIAAAEARGVMRGLELASRRGPLLESAQTASRDADGRAASLRGQVAELEDLINAVREAQAQAASAGAPPDAPAA